ncbi:DUF4465 domain-containing protein [Flavivirga jejuensis]|uniref:DUF4465 domain-containing protein n=1 Tax=Flavivirga jejuensis TaxID=870487 RepID=A0ABT8WR35_9FLAO|nr:DUF4465 domain-containing protein [Flavivirga jejuensis]MDO5975620.1 DUF4465 domain-containing protein [Flavivirga jejuensis]
MKFIQYIKAIFVALIAFVGIVSCDDDDEIRIPFPDDINFNEIELERFSSEIPTAPFTAGENASRTITVNVVSTGGTSFSGFALSNRNWRSYPWSLSPDYEPAGGLSATEQQQAIDSTAFSVYTNRTNRTETYLIGNAVAEDAFFTLNQPAVIEHILVSNTTYNYLLTEFGSVFSGDFLDFDAEIFDINGGPIFNPNIPNEDRGGRFFLPAPGGVEAISLFSHSIVDNVDGAFVKLEIEGSLNGNVTGTVDAYLATTPGGDPENPNFDFVLNDWVPIDLTSLGQVDRVLFRMSSSYVDGSGDMIYPPTFCLDGIRIQQ